MPVPVAIFVQVILPILCIIAAGALVQWRFALHLKSLSRLTIYLFVPAYLFVSVYTSTLGWGEIAAILGLMLAVMAIVVTPLAMTLRRLRVDGPTLGAILLAAVVYNAGNVGIPVAEFFYRVQGPVFPGMQHGEDGVAVQALVLLGSSLSIWLLGYGVLAAAKGDGWRGALGFFRLPILWSVLLAFVLREAGVDVVPAVLDPVRLVAGAAVPIMLLTLGAQLVASAPRPRWGMLVPVLSTKLLVMPILTGLLAWLVGMWPWPGAQLVIAASAPTAVNTVLLNLELDADPKTAADCVFWSTLVSCVTMTVTMSIVLGFASG